MYRPKNIKIAFAILVTVAGVSCTKLDQKLNSTLTQSQTANALSADLLLQTAYTDIGNPYSDMGNIFALEEVVADECLVPTRGGDWDDNGKWRALHQHTWTIDGVDAILNQFNNLNKIQFDATNVLTFKTTDAQASEARFIRALALYQLFDLYGQYPYRNPGDNLLNAPQVKSGQEAIDFIISELTDIIPKLPASNPSNRATPDAAKFLLMKCYLNKGAFLNRANPTFADADMQQVITLGNQIINSGKYALDSNYFRVFSPVNANNKDGIFTYANTSGVQVGNSGIDNRWWSTLHYNQYDKYAPQAGWNGFSTVAEFYNTFSLTGNTTLSLKDSTLDYRIGERYYWGSTNISGIRPGMLIGQQFDEKGNPLKDRKGNALAFTPVIANDLKELGNNLEVTGIRVIKYVPDYSNDGKNYSGTAGNWLMLFRYADVLLMVAEAKMRAASPDMAGALKIVNDMRGVRGAQPMPSLTLVNTGNVYDPNTLLAERGRELYWEAVRRTDLIRFGVFLKPWAYKTTDNAKYLLFPIPTSSLALNPNLKQNPGY